MARVSLLPTLLLSIPFTVLAVFTLNILLIDFSAANLVSQGVPQASPEQATPPGPPPVAAAWFDPSTGSYIGPDGPVYTQSDLARGAQQRTWQDMLTGPRKN